jgi:hypothetical protein
LLDAVRDAINTDPDTGLSRPPLGHTDDTLFIEPITRTAIEVHVYDLDAPAGTLANVQDRIESAVESYLLSVVPFISGLDLDEEQADTVTAVSVAAAIQPVLDVTGSYATKVDILISSVVTASYTLDNGETVKLDTISWEVSP